MLLSPLMGPVMALTFGTMISDRKLQKIGVRSGMVGMGISLVFGYIFGCLVGCTESPWGTGNWPTEAMIDRGMARSLWVGVLWALPSGTGVAIAVLQASTGPLVGVAISASLLPPVVNCGVLWGLATIMHIYPEVKLPYVKGEPLDSNVTSYKMMYSDHLPNELTAMGIISFCLTIINIACIFITALIVLKIKEVAAPYTSSPDLRRFWEYDIRMARENNRSSSMQSSGAHGANKQKPSHLQRLQHHWWGTIDSRAAAVAGDYRIYLQEDTTSTPAAMAQPEAPDRLNHLLYFTEVGVCTVDGDRTFDYWDVTAQLPETAATPVTLSDGVPFCARADTTAVIPLDRDYNGNLDEIDHLNIENGGAVLSPPPPPAVRPVTEAPPQHKEDVVRAPRETESPQPIAGPSSAQSSGPINQIGGALPQGTPGSNRDAQTWLEERINALLGRLQDHGVSTEDHVGLLLVNTDSSSRPVFVSFRRADQLDAQAVLSNVERVLKSNDSFLTSSPLYIKLHHFKEPRGKGNHKCDRLSPASTYSRNNKGITTIQNGDTLYLARALVVAKAICDVKR
uniref:Uncharacterized protein n=1 Tax=Timema shepardi TaxID=629360 RepID=A0A7R9G3U7_TIMSH|nr:unnamed protein product [Timema shepardi]